MENLSLNSLAHDLETRGCVIRRHRGEVEVWGTDISEHYTIYLSPSGDEATDIVYLGASVWKQRVTERRVCLG